MLVANVLSVISKTQSLWITKVSLKSGHHSWERRRHHVAKTWKNDENKNVWIWYGLFIFLFWARAGQRAFMIWDRDFTTLVTDTNTRRTKLTQVAVGVGIQQAPLQQNNDTGLASMQDAIQNDNNQNLTQKVKTIVNLFRFIQQNNHSCYGDCCNALATVKVLWKLQPRFNCDNVLDRTTTQDTRTRKNKWEFGIHNNKTQMLICSGKQ